MAEGDAGPVRVVLPSRAGSSAPPAAHTRAFPIRFARKAQLPTPHHTARDIGGIQPVSVVAEADKASDVASLLPPAGRVGERDTGYTSPWHVGVGPADLVEGEGGVDGWGTPARARSRTRRRLRLKRRGSSAGTAQELPSSVPPTQHGSVVARSAQPLIVEDRVEEMVAGAPMGVPRKTRSRTSFRALKRASSASLPPILPGAPHVSARAA